MGELSEKDKEQMACEHYLIANAGRGGRPRFRVNSQMGPQPIMSVVCQKCTARTWLTKPQWLDHLKEMGR